MKSFNPPSLESVVSCTLSSSSHQLSAASTQLQAGWLLNLESWLHARGPRTTDNGLRTLFLALNRQDVHQREDEHPHQVHEVPVQPRHFHIFRTQLALAEPACDDAQVNDATEDVGHVQASQREECCAEQRRTPGVMEQPHALANQPHPLGGVDDHEQQA